MSDQRKNTKTKPGNCSAIALLSYRLSRSLSRSRSHSPSADNEWLSGPTTSAPVLIVIYTAAAVPEANYYHSMLNSLSDFLFTHKSVFHISLSFSLSICFTRVHSAASSLHLISNIELEHHYLCVEFISWVRFEWEHKTGIAAKVGQVFLTRANLKLTLQQKCDLVLRSISLLSGRAAWILLLTTLLGQLNQTTLTT